MPRLNSVILTPEALLEALKERKARSDGAAGLAVQLGTEVKKLEKELLTAKKHHAKAVEAYERTRESYEEIKAMALKEPRLSKHGKVLGRPRLTDEEKARRATERANARKAARVAAVSAPVEVPADLQPLIPTPSE